MNIALATLVIILLIFPGLIFRRTYYTSEFSKDFFKESFLDFLLPTIIPSVLLHSVGYLLFVHWRYYIDFKVLLTLLNGSADKELAAGAYDNIQKNVHNILFYYLGVCALSAAAGLLTKYFIRKLKLDRRYEWFRFPNKWHYIFSGEILDYKNGTGRSEDIEFTYVDVLVKMSEGDIIYSGILEDYILSKEEGLDRIYLSSVKRRFLKDDPKKVNQQIENEGDDVYYNMPGEYFIIPYNQVINLHLTYYRIEVDAELDAELKNVKIE